MNAGFTKVVIAALVTSIGLVLAASAIAQAADDVDLRLYRLDCGHIFVKDLNVWSDTEAYPGQTKELTNSCFLIKHGEDWLLWDTGLPARLVDSDSESGPHEFSAETTLTAQFEELGLAPEDIDYVGLSHAHIDHVGNANMFANSTLIIQKAEYNAAFSGDPPPGVEPDLLSTFKDGANVESVSGDYDVFGDGSVITFFTPGHTPGHQALLVRLPKAGPVILSGDAVHFTENWRANQVPDVNTDRAKTLATLDRLKRLVENLDARFVIQHEPSNIDKLPEFPAYLK